MNGPSTEDPDAKVSSTGADADTAVPSEALVQITDDLAVFFGDRIPEGLSVVPFSFVDSETRTAMSTALARGTSGANSVAQGVNGLVQAQGLVRLAPQTLAQLKTAAPLVKGGWNLGALAADGRIVASVRWLPAGGATAMSVATSMGPALTLVAIQFQLNEITKLAQHNLELTRAVLQVIRQEQWSDVVGHYEVLTKELRHARAAGVVSDAIYAEVRGYQGRIAAQWDHFEHAARGHAEALKALRSHKDRRRWLTDNGQAVIADVQALLLAQSSWFAYQALRAGHLLATAQHDPQNEALLSHLVSEIAESHRDALEAADQLLDDLASELSLIALLPGRRTLKVGGASRAADDVAVMVRQLQGAMASIGGYPASVEPTRPVIPEVTVFENDAPGELLDVLRFRLRPGEAVLGLADAALADWNWDVRSAGWVVVTDARLLVAKQDAFRRLGDIERDIDLDDVRYVRRQVTGNDRTPRIDVITKRANLELHFPGWAKAPARRADVDAFVQLLASFMQLPEAEVPSRPIRLLASEVPSSRGGSSTSLGSTALEAAEKG